MTPKIRFIRRPLAYLYHYMLSYGGYAKKIKHVDFEVSSVCNLKCPMCGVSRPKRRTNGLMTLDDFKVIAAKLPVDLRGLNLMFAGEPLLNRDVFAMIRHYRTLNKSARVRISTNGTNLHVFEPEEILTSGVSQIDVAIDGASAQTHESYRRGSDFNAICRNVRKLCEEKKRLRLESPKMVMITLLSKKTKPELDRIKMLAKELGFDELHLRYMVIPGLGKEESDIIGTVSEYIDAEERASFGKEYFVEEPYGFYRMPVRTRRDGRAVLPQDYKIVGEKRHCASFLNPVIYHNGDVSICCVDGEGDYTVGNLLKEGFETVVSRIPAKAIFGRKLPICKSCVRSRKGFNHDEIKIY